MLLSGNIGVWLGYLNRLVDLLLFLDLFLDCFLNELLNRSHRAYVLFLLFLLVFLVLFLLLFLFQELPEHGRLFAQETIFVTAAVTVEVFARHLAEKRLLASRLTRQRGRPEHGFRRSGFFRKIVIDVVGERQSG